MQPVRTTGDHSFPPTLRLRKRPDFLRLTNAPDKYVSRGILVVWQTNGLAMARLGITVSKKIGCAVTRNRIKRYVRDIFRQNNSGLPPVDVNVIARNGSALMNYENVRCELLKAFDHIHRSLCSNALHS